MNTLAEVLSSCVKAEIFRLLFGPVSQELHGRESERQLGLTDATVRQELRRLSRLGCRGKGKWKRIRMLAQRNGMPLPALVADVDTLDAKVKEHLARMGVTF